jgi:hypothetical protein
MLSANFLNPNPGEKNAILEFHSSDTEHEFAHNKRKLGKSWEYFDKKVEYHFNELGFRNKPFDQVNWKKSVVIIGCSIVEGVGLAEEDTIGKKLEEILNIPVVNLGVGGSGADVASWNSLILHEHYPHPSAIVQLWSGLDRYNISKQGQHNLQQASKSTYVDLNWERRSKFYIESDRALWKNKTIYHESSFFDHTAIQMNIEHFNSTSLARDLQHPGSNDTCIIARLLADRLMEKGLTRQ